MSSPTLRRLLQDWFREEVEGAPRADPRRTPLCLRFPEVSAYAQGALTLPGARARHIAECEWCQRAVHHLRAAEAAAAEQVTISAGIAGRWPRELRDRLADWLRLAEAEDRDEHLPLSGRFDETGTLRVRLSGLHLQGPVRVSLYWQGVEVPLARGVVQGGVLEIAEPMPEMGLRSLGISPRLLRVHPEEVR